MKHVRNILLLIILMFGFILQAEIYQNELWTYNGAYYLCSEFNVSESEELNFLKDLKQAANRNNVHLFSSNMEVRSNYTYVMDIYGDDAETRASLYDTMRLEEGTYNSLLGGITDVCFHDFDEMLDYKNIDLKLVSYVGDKSDVMNVYHEVSSKYDISMPAYWQTTEHDMIIVVWGMIAILMVIMNGVDALRRQKEIVVRRSFGESEILMIAKSALFDIVSYILLFVLAKILTMQFTRGEYAWKLIIIVYLIGGIVSLLPYLMFLKFDVRKAFANTQENGIILKFMYVMKFVAFMACVFTLATNLNTIHGDLVSSGDFLEPYFDSYYYNVMSAEMNPDIEDDFWKLVYEKEYEILKPTICTCVFKDRHDVILVNENARGMLQGFSSIIDENSNSDFIVAIPKGRLYESDKACANMLLSKALEGRYEASKIDYISYDSYQKFSYLDTSATDGISEASNPIIVYQVSENNKFDAEFIATWIGARRIIFKCSVNEWNEVLAKYDFSLGTYKSIVTSVRDDYQYHHSFLVKLISFLSSLCIVVIILDIVIIIVMNRMEYKRHSLEIALRKVLGYSMVERHRNMLKSMLVMNVIAIILLGMISMVLSSLKFSIYLPIAAMATVIEILIMGINIASVEHNGIPKALKGGTL
ncbi:MAG: DUF1430 domain-containing protein [Eubacteriales bacterium]|nr:DUF1430 domain-containing protein [Eubacteriales bacterium]